MLKELYAEGWNVAFRSGSFLVYTFPEMQLINVCGTVSPE
jgi:hypothetical protein